MGSDPPSSPSPSPSRAPPPSSFEEIRGAYNALPSRHHVAQATPLIFLMGSERYWEFGEAEAMRLRAGALPAGVGPLAGFSAASASSAGGHAYNSLGGRTSVRGLHASPASPEAVPVTARTTRHIGPLQDAACYSLSEAEMAVGIVAQPWHVEQLQRPVAEDPNDSASSSPESTEYLKDVVRRLVSGGTWATWELPVQAVLRAASDAESGKYWQSLVATRDVVMVLNTLHVVVAFAFELMREDFGHRLFQKLVSACELSSLKTLVRKVAHDGEQLVDTAKHRHGEQCIRHLLLAVKKSKSQVRMLTASLSPHVSDLMTNKIGANLIETCLNRLCNQQNMFIYDHALEHLKEIARTQFGCLSLNKCIDHAPWSTKQKFVEKIVSYAACLSQDPYGNFVVQHILQLHDEEYTEKLCREIKDHCVQFSTQKFGSRVVERCIASTGGRHLLEVLVACGNVEQLARDAYGNFVLQRALLTLKKGETEMYEKLVKPLMEHAHTLRSHRNAKHVYELLDKEEPGKEKSPSR